MKKMNVIDWIALILVFIGGLNWGLVGVANFDVVAEIFGVDSTVANIVYIVVGLSALYTLIMAFAKTSSKEGQVAAPQQGGMMK